MINLKTSDTPNPNDNRKPNINLNLDIHPKSINKPLT